MRPAAKPVKAARMVAHRPVAAEGRQARRVATQPAVAGRQRKRQDNPEGNRAAARVHQVEPERRAAARRLVPAQQVALLRPMLVEAHPVEPGQQERKMVLPGLATERAVRRVKADRRLAQERTPVAVQQAAVRRLTEHHLMAARAVLDHRTYR